nr:MAG TPA: hypothetical protein [Caudoviricetes sp.]
MCFTLLYPMCVLMSMNMCVIQFTQFFRLYMCVISLVIPVLRLFYMCVIV